MTGQTDAAPQVQIDQVRQQISCRCRMHLDRYVLVNGGRQLGNSCPIRTRSRKRGENRRFA